jgi:hypothetical protein
LRSFTFLVLGLVTGFEKFLSSWANQEVQALLLVRPGISWFDQELHGLTNNFLAGQDVLILKYELFVRKPSL